MNSMYVLDINIDMRRRFHLWCSQYRLGRIYLHCVACVHGKIKDIYVHVKGILREW